MLVYMVPMSNNETGNPASYQSNTADAESELDVHFLASSVLKSRYVMIPDDLQPWIASTQTMDYCTLSA